MGLALTSAMGNAQTGDGFIFQPLSSGKALPGTQRDSHASTLVELKGGDASSLFALARRFAGDAILLLSFESKAERGYRLVAGAAPTAQNGGAAHIRGDMTCADAFALVMRACLAQVCGNAHMLRETRNAEALHQLRVGLRRLHAALAVFKPILPGKELSKMAAEIKWMGGELDTARDLDVFIVHTSSSILIQVYRHARSAELELRAAHDESRQKVKGVCRGQWGGCLGVRRGEVGDLFVNELIGLGRDAAADERRFEHM